MTIPPAGGAARATDPRADDQSCCFREWWQLRTCIFRLRYFWGIRTSVARRKDALIIAATFWLLFSRTFLNVGRYSLPISNPTPFAPVFRIIDLEKNSCQVFGEQGAIGEVLVMRS